MRVQDDRLRHRRAGGAGGFGCPPANSVGVHPWPSRSWPWTSWWSPGWPAEPSAGGGECGGADRGGAAGETTHRHQREPSFKSATQYASQPESAAQLGQAPETSGSLGAPIHIRAITQPFGGSKNAQPHVLHSIGVTASRQTRHEYREHRQRSVGAAVRPPWDRPSTSRTIESIENHFKTEAAAATLYGTEASTV